MPHKVVITVNSPGRSGPPKTMLEVFESSEIEYSVIPCSNENELIAAAKDADVLLDFTKGAQYKSARGAQDFECCAKGALSFISPQVLGAGL